MRAIRAAARTMGDLGVYGWRTGRWWLPVLVVLLAVTAAVVGVVQAAVPTVVYTLF